MTSAGKTLTTGEYSKISGLSVSTISKMLRQGKLQGRKLNGKWAIEQSEAQNIQSTPHKPDNSEQKKSDPALEQTPCTASKAKTYAVDAFARLTYLTEKGVRQFLKSGRLTGSVDEHGNLLIDADNLNRLEIHHLIRK